MRTKVPFSGKSYLGKSSNVSSERSINLYSETPNTSQLTFYPSNNTAAKSPVYYKFPGLEKLGVITGANTKIRGTIIHNGLQYIVANNKLYSRTSSGTISASLGTLGTSTGRVSMATNGSFGNQLIIVDGTATYYIWNSSTTTFSSIATPVSILLPTHNILPTSVVYMDGYFIMNDNGYAQFYLSNPFDGLVFTTTNSASAEKDPDNIVALAATHKELYLIGETTTEVWYNSGSIFPFDPVPNIFIEKGGVAPKSVVSIEGIVIFLARTKEGGLEIVMLEGGQQVSISTAPIEYQFSTYVTPEDAIANTFKVDNHSFYSLSFIGQDKTWLYDITEKEWHELSSNYPIEAREGRWLGDFVVFFAGVHIVLSEDFTNIYKLNVNKYNEDGVQQHWYLISQAFESDRERLFFPMLEVYMEHGTGSQDTSSPDPVLQLDWSDDGGKTWSNIRREPFGKAGEYFRLVRFSKLGQSRNRIFRLHGADPVKTNIVGVFITVDKATSV